MVGGFSGSPGKRAGGCQDLRRKQLSWGTGVRVETGCVSESPPKWLAEQLRLRMGHVPTFGALGTCRAPQGFPLLPPKPGLICWASLGMSVLWEVMVMPRRVSRELLTESGPRAVDWCWQGHLEHGGGQKTERGWHLRWRSESPTSEPWEERSVSGWPGGNRHPPASLSQSGLGRKRGTSISGVTGGPGRGPGQRAGSHGDSGCLISSCDSFCSFLAPRTPSRGRGKDPERKSDTVLSCVSCPAGKAQGPLK